MPNLYKETILLLKEKNKTFDDVVWIGCNEFEFPKDQFFRLANEEYDDGFGSQEVAQDLLIVGKDFWLERHEYDGSEWWEYKTVPVKPKEVKVLKRLMGGMWKTLQELNEEEEKQTNNSTAPKELPF